MLSSVVFGGADTEPVSGLAVDAAGAAYVVGVTGSTSFPVATVLSTFGVFAAKVAADGTLTYATHLPPQDYANSPLDRVPVASEDGGSILVGYFSGLYRVSADGSSASKVADLPDLIANIAVGPRGNIFVASELQAGDLGSVACTRSAYTAVNLPRGDLVVTKLQAGSLQPLYTTHLHGQCETRSNSLVVSSNGQATVGAVTFGEFPLVNPALSVSPLAWANGAALVARLSADGGEVIYSSYLDTYIPPPITLAPDGSIYAGVTQTANAFFFDAPPAVSYGAAVLHLPAARRPRGITIHRASNAFDASAAVVPGTLVAISGANFTPLVADLGLQTTAVLPTTLEGVQVLFDGVASPLVRVAPEEIVCLVPQDLPRSESVTVQVVNAAGQRSQPTVIALGRGVPGLLSQHYPLVPDSPVDGVVFNADGTANNSFNPAAVGSTITVFGTGIPAPGPVPVYWGAPLVFPVLDQPLSGLARAAAGYLPGIYAIDVTLPRDATRPQTVVGGLRSGVIVYVK